MSAPGELMQAEASGPVVPFHHRLEVDCRVGALPLKIGATFEQPWSILFGASGSGKSSLLRALCGLLPGAQARVFRAEPAGIVEITALPPHLRSIAYAPQQPALFPHLSVLRNISFAVRPGSVDGQRLVEEALDTFELRGMAERMPSNLSGGERQRVNLARAFAVPGARLLLLDEPFTGLDLKLRDRLLPAMQHLLAARNLPCISVTHDVDEALLVGAEVYRMDQGRILGHGPAWAALAEERKRLLATLERVGIPASESGDRDR